MNCEPVKSSWTTTWVALFQSLPEERSKPKRTILQGVKFQPEFLANRYVQYLEWLRALSSFERFSEEE